MVRRSRQESVDTDVDGYLNCIDGIKMENKRRQNAGFVSWVLKVFLVIGAIFLINYWIETKEYLFNHEDLEKIAEKYKDQSSFFIMNAGGWMGQVCVLHASLSEYVLVFNTVQETQGHSGRYWLNITDYVIAGWIEQWQEKTFKAVNFTAGITVHHPWLTSTGVRFGANSWFLEYGRGFVPSSMLFASADVFFSTHDFFAWYEMISAFTKGLLREAYITVDNWMAQIHTL